jgi:glycine C-acetyltransferase
VADSMLDFLSTETTNHEHAGLLRQELMLESPQGATIAVGKKELCNLAASDYLGLAGHSALKKAAKAAIDDWGVGVAAPRLVGGTLTIHNDLEGKLTRWLGVEDALVFPSGYHANTGLFESLVGERDFVFCDDQIHPTLADGIRLSRTRVFSYRNNDMDHLEDLLKRSRAARFRMIVTDGVFPLDGNLAPLGAICALAAKYGALVAVDESQGIGVLGNGGKGTVHASGMAGKVDVITGSFSNALGSPGGFVAGRRSIVEWLRQKSRPYLASAALAPSSAAAALAALDLLSADNELIDKLRTHVAVFRETLEAGGLRPMASEHPIVSVMIGDAVPTQRMADLLYRKGIFAMGFCHPVVPEGAARIRAQVSAAHTQKALKAAAEAFVEAAREVGVI